MSGTIFEIRLEGTLNTCAFSEKENIDKISIEESYWFFSVVPYVQRSRLRGKTVTIYSVSTIDPLLSVVAPVLSLSRTLPTEPSIFPFATTFIASHQHLFGVVGVHSGVWTIARQRRVIRDNAIICILPFKFFFRKRFVLHASTKRHSIPSLTNRGQSVAQSVVIPQ